MTLVRFVSADGDERPGGRRAAPASACSTSPRMPASRSKGTCEGQMACSTCHVIVDAEDFAKLPRASEEEEDMLDLAAHVTRHSRLACQIWLTEELETPDRPHARRLPQHAGALSDRPPRLPRCGSAALAAGCAGHPPDGARRAARRVPRRFAASSARAAGSASPRSTPAAAARCGSTPTAATRCARPSSCRSPPPSSPRPRPGALALDRRDSPSARPTCSTMRRGRRRNLARGQAAGRAALRGDRRGQRQ